MIYGLHVCAAKLSLWICNGNRNLQHAITDRESNFQACSFIRLRSRARSARAPPRRRTTTRTSLRLDSTTCERSRRHYRTRLRHDRICARSSFYSTGFGVGHDLRAQELCQTSQCGQITRGRSTIDSTRAVASGHRASRAAGRTGTAAVGLQFNDADTLQETSTTRPRRRGFSSRSCAVAISATCVGSNHAHALLVTVAPRARRTRRIHMNIVEVSSLRPTPEERE